MINNDQITLLSYCTYGINLLRSGGDTLLLIGQTCAILLVLMFTIFRQGKVPDMLFSTTELPPDISINGKGCLLQARYVMHFII